MLNKAFTDHKDERLALKKMDELFVRVFKENAGQISAAFKMSYFQFKGDTENFSNNCLAASSESVTSRSYAAKNSARSNQQAEN